jgi:hypothetical protein
MELSSKTASLSAFFTLPLFKFVEEVSEICDLRFNLLGSGRSVDAMEPYFKYDIVLVAVSLLSSRSREKFHSKRTPLPSAYDPGAGKG